MGPISTSTILFIDNGPRATSQRERELQSAVVRAHAAKISHQRRKGPRSVDKSRRQRRGTRLAHDAEGPRIEDEKKEDEEDDIVDICGFDTTATDCSEEASPDTRCLTRVGRTTTTNLLWLDQTTRDPFNIEPSRNVSAVIHDLMNYAYDCLFPKNMVAVDKSSLKEIMTSRRKLAVQNLAEFHAQISNAATMAFGVVTDETTIGVITRTRLTHQSMAIKLIGQEMMDLRGPPSELLIQRVLLLTTQGGDPLDSWGLEIHPESPIVKSSNLKGYHRFRIMPEHHRALVYLLKEKGGLDKITMVGLARRLQLSDTSTATRECKRPHFPLLPSLADAVSGITFSFDDEAFRLQSVLGSAFAPLLWTTLTTVHSNLLMQACRITIALDQYHRGGVNHSTLNDLNISAVVLQHKLYSAPTLLELYPQEHDDHDKIPYVDYLNEATRFAIMIYMDMVLWPLPWAVGVKPRLAARLKGVLPRVLPDAEFAATSRSAFGHGHYLHPENTTPSSGTAPLGLEIYHIYLLLIGGIAATYTIDRPFYVQRLFLHSRGHFHTWADFKDAMTGFLWWDYVFDEPALKLWTEAYDWGLSLSQSPSPSPSPHLVEKCPRLPPLRPGVEPAERMANPFTQFPWRPR